MSALAGPELLRRIVLVLTTTLLVARPLVLGEDPGLAADLSDPNGMALTLLWLAAAVCWAGWRFWLGRRPADAVEGRPAPDWYGGAVQAALLATVAVVFLSSAFAARYKYPALLIACEWGGLFIAFLVVQQMAVSIAERNGLFTALLAVAVALSAHGVYQNWVELPRLRRDFAADPQGMRQALARQGMEPSEALMADLWQRSMQDNIFGPYAHPNSFAGFLALFLPGLVGAAILASWHAPRWQAVLALLCAVLAGVSLWLTHSRGAILASAVVGLGAAALVWRRTLRAHLLATLVGVVVLGGLAYGAYRGGLLTTAMGKESGTVALRLEYWRTTWQVIRERPWLGVGPGNFADNYLRLMPETAGEKIKDPHNFALEMWATSGVLAMLLLVAALAAFFVPMLRWLWRGGEGGVTPPLPESPHVPRLDFYLGGVFGLLLGFVLRISDMAPEGIIAEAVAAGLRSLVWFAAYGLLERVPWTDRARGLALTAGVAALLLNLCVSGGIGFPSLALLLWAAVALALASRGPERVPLLSRPGPATLLPLPVLAALAVVYGVYVFYPVMGSAELVREAVRNGEFFREKRGGPLALKTSPTNYLRKKIIEPLEQAARLEPDDARIQVLLASWYGQLWGADGRDDSWKLAVAHARQAIRLNPDGRAGYWAEFRVRKNFAVILEDSLRKRRDLGVLKRHELEQKALGEHKEAALALERYLPHDPTDAGLHFLVAESWFKAGDEAACRREAAEALRLDEANPTRKLTDPQREQVRKWLEAASAG